MRVEKGAPVGERCAAGGMFTLGLLGGAVSEERNMWRGKTKADRVRRVGRGEA